MGCSFSALSGEAGGESDSRNDVLFFPDAKVGPPHSGTSPLP
jgi:hypothetical protein